MLDLAEVAAGGVHDRTRLVVLAQLDERVGKPDPGAAGVPDETARLERGDRLAVRLQRLVDHLGAGERFGLLRLDPRHLTG